MLFFKERNTQTRSFEKNARLCCKKRSLCFEPLERRDLLSLPGAGTADLNALDEMKYLSSGTISITTLKDKVDPTDGLISLREAINYANSTGTQIEFALSGTIHLESTLSIQKSLTINNQGLRTITLDGSNSLDQSCFIDIRTSWTSSEMEVSFENISIKDCKNTSNGGGVFIGENCNVSFNNCFFLNNRSEMNGGALYFEGKGSLSNSIVNGNSAKNGGAIALNSDQTTTIDSTSFKDNRATENGGTLYFNQSNYDDFNDLSSSVSLLDVSNSEVSNSSAKNGGAFWFDECFCTVSDTMLRNNEGSNNGGGIYIGDNGYLLIERSSLVSNTANGSGGALYNKNVIYSNANFYKKNSVESDENDGLKGSGGAITNIFYFSSSGDKIQENSASNLGAGIMNYYYSADEEIEGTCQLVDLSLERNRSDKEGGGIYNYGEIDLINSSVSGNSGSSGGGIYNHNWLGLSRIEIVQSVFSDNIATDMGGGIDNCGSLVITKSTFINNRAGDYSSQSGSGGAINNNYFGKLTVSSSRFIENVAYLGGAIYDSAEEDSENGTGNVNISNSYFQRNCDSEAVGFKSEHYNILDTTNTQGANYAGLKKYSNSLVLYDAYGNIVSGTINFGAVALHNTTSYYTFRIVNQGSESIFINGVDTFLGNCITYSIEGSVNSFELAVGESKRLTFVLKPSVLEPSAMYVRFELGGGLDFQVNAACVVVDNAGEVSSSEITLNSEVSTGSYTLKLNQQPASDVKVILSAPEGIILDTTELIFTSGNYNQNQNVCFRWDAGKLASLPDPLERLFISHILVYNPDLPVDPLRNLKISDKEVRLSYTVRNYGSTESDPGAIEPVRPETIFVTSHSFGANDEVLSLSINIPFASVVSNWQIDWGDGLIENVFYRSSRLKKAHYYKSPGIYTVRLKIFNADENIKDYTYCIWTQVVSGPESASELPASFESGDPSFAALDTVLGEGIDLEETEITSLLAESLSPDQITNHKEVLSFFSFDFMDEKDKKNGLFSGDFIDL